MWRKNRNPNPGLPGRGVDLNRNYDFLWSSGIGTSSSSTSETYKGSGPFSEPETRNVRYLLNTYTNTRMLVDVHSFSELALFPWGDDDNQSTNPSMSFENHIFDGLRGTRGDTRYREYIPSEDATWFSTNGTRIRDAIAAVRGRRYTLEQSVGLYPTSATSEDYAFARHFEHPARKRVRALTLETGREFQPAFPEAQHVMNEGSAGVLESCVVNLCYNTYRAVSSALRLAAGRQDAAAQATGTFGSNCYRSTLRKSWKSSTPIQSIPRRRPQSLLGWRNKGMPKWLSRNRQPNLFFAAGRPVSWMKVRRCFARSFSSVVTT